MTSLPAAFPLLGRPLQDIVFRLHGHDVTAGSFLHAAGRIAEALPDRHFVINACQGRFEFALTFAAALMRGQITLLSGERSSEPLRNLSKQYPGLYLATDDASPDDASPNRAVPRHLIAPFALSDPGRSLAVPRLPATQLAAIVFTSGSTGQPAAHAKSWGTLFERSRDAAACFGFHDDHPAQIVGMVPPQHMYGFETTVLLALHVGVSSWCGAAFYPRDVAGALSLVPVPRVLVTTPLQLAALLRGSVRLPPLARIISATAPLGRELAAAAEQCWHTEVHEIFGATEVGSIASRRTTESDVWQTYPHVRLEPDNAADGPCVHATAPYAAAHPLNDVIELLDPQQFRLLGRRSDMVKLGGRRASLAELNRILGNIEGVIDGQFVAPAELETEPNARLQVFAVAPQRSAESILRELRRQIDPLFLPRRVVLVDRLPRNETGKLTSAAIAALRGDPHNL
jgi:acyl-coenzyme A synthetase/AMP-(fatty) acid ligase